MGQRMSAVQNAFDDALLAFERPYRHIKVDPKSGLGLKLREYLQRYPEHGEPKEDGSRQPSALVLTSQLTMGDTIDSDLLLRAEKMLARKVARGETTGDVESVLIGYLSNPETNVKWAHTSIKPKSDEAGRLLHEDTPDQIYRLDGKSHFRGDRPSETEITHLVRTFTQLLKDTLARDEVFRAVAGVNQFNAVGS